MLKIILPKGYGTALEKSQEDEAVVGAIGAFIKKPVAPNPRLGSGK